MRITEIITEAAEASMLRWALRTAPKIMGYVEKLGLAAPFARYFYMDYMVYRPRIGKDMTQEQYNTAMADELGFVLVGIVEWLVANKVIKSVASILAFVPKMMLPRKYSYYITASLERLATPAAQAAFIAFMNSDAGRMWLAKFTLFGLSENFGAKMIHNVGAYGDDLLFQLETWVREAVGAAPPEPRPREPGTQTPFTHDANKPKDDTGDIDWSAGQAGQDAPDTGTASWDWTPKGMKKGKGGYLTYDVDTLK